MTNFDPANPSSEPLSFALRRILSNRFVLLAINGGAIVLTAKFNWGWLVAAGIAPLLLSAGPCLAMCALGLCMKGGRKSQADYQSAPQQTGFNVVPPLQLTEISNNSGSDATYGIAPLALSGQPANYSDKANNPKPSSTRKGGCC